MTSSRPHAFALLGPTASGKTNLALKLAQYLPIEIISLDSALVYQDMNIGTAKPTPNELASVPHHLIDIITPDQTYSAANFVDDCCRLVPQIRQRQHIPLIVGGTMMYYHALTQGLNTLPSANPLIRQQLQQEKQQYGLEYLYNQLKHIDPVTALRVQAHDSQRIERSLEIFRLTGKSMSQHFSEQKQHKPPLTLTSIALIPTERSLLHEKIAQRFHHMLAQGFIHEVACLRQTYPNLHADMPAMRCVGYRQVWYYLDQLINMDQLINQGIAATRQLAKRQITWLRKLGADYVLSNHDTNQQLLLQIIKTSQHHEQ